MKIKINKKQYWNKFYKKFNTQPENNFSRFLILCLKKSNHNVHNKFLIDISCCNSRDLKYFNNKKMIVTRLDQSNIAINYNQ